jgi:hypothetical protein
MTDEFDSDSEVVTDEESNEEYPALETADEYGYEEPSTDVPAPPDDEDQNPGHSEDEQ